MLARYIVDLPEFYPLLNTFSREEIRLWKDIHRRIFVCLESIWSCVREVLCSDAPEGHVPEGLEDELEVDTKDILSYSWRALKEAWFVTYQVYSILLTNVALSYGS